MHLKLEQDDGRKEFLEFFIDFSSVCFLFFSRTLGGCLQESTHCYTLEVSFFSYQTSTNSQAIPYTEELCKKNIFLINT
jgi:hypothetical protein